MSSKFGYILTGKYCDPTDIKGCEGQITACVVTSHMYYDLCLNLWSLEKIGITDSLYEREDGEAFEHFNNTISYRDGRYFVAWLWRPFAYDASAKVRKYGKSLNECLFRGPINLPDICRILLRFCIYIIVVLADIEKAFFK